MWVCAEGEGLCVCACACLLSLCLGDRVGESSVCLWWEGVCIGMFSGCLPVWGSVRATSVSEGAWGPHVFVSGRPCMLVCDCHGNQATAAPEGSPRVPENTLRSSRMDALPSGIAVQPHSTAEASFWVPLNP